MGRSFFGFFGLIGSNGKEQKITKISKEEFDKKNPDFSQKVKEKIKNKKK